MSGLLGVTGATGYVGGRVTRLLDDHGVSQRLLVRDPDSPRLPALTRPVPVARVDYAEASAEPLRGVDVLFMVSAHESRDRARDQVRFVEAAAQAGVRHVVYTSFVSAAPDAVFTLARDHHATEEAIKASGMGWTLLRDSFYLDFLEHMIGDDGVIRGPAGDGRCAFVARDDVARVAAVVLREPGAHDGVTYDLTGPRGLTMAEVAEVLGRHQGRGVRFHDETVEEAYASRGVFDAPSWQVDAWVSTYTAIASGVMAEPSDAVEHVTGAPPLGLAEVLRGTAR